MKNSLTLGNSFSIRLLALVRAGVLLGLILTCGQFAFAANFTVNSTSDEPDAAAGDGACATASATCTLRAAIQESNALTGNDTIIFSVATIAPATSLPAITETVNISGGASPAVELSGASAGVSGIGLRISASSCVVEGLIINRFQEAGIRIDTGAGNTIRGNIIGTNAAGAIGLGNFNRGILIVGSTGNIIGGTTAGERNIISGNSGTGISITGGGQATISGNYIGTNAAGTAAVSNTQEGIRIVDSSNSTIGGTTAGAGNVISGNDGSGVSIIRTDTLTSAAANSILGNFIGTTASGNAALANDGSGVLINANGNIVGGTTAAARNVISGNGANGVSLASNFATGNSVRGNYIGVGTDGTTALANTDNGVQISALASGNTIGGIPTVGACDGACNVIANNGLVTSTSARAGIYLDSTALAGNQIRGNRIFSNFGTGIDLGGVGATANDTNDGDAGPNNLQNKPVLNFASATNNTVSGTLNSTDNTFAIDFYINSIADGVTSEARTYIGSTSVTVVGNNGSFSLTFPGGVLVAGQYVTATATATSGSFSPDAPQAVGDTSEESAARMISVATAGTAPISGRVVNKAGDAMEGLTIVLHDLQTGAETTSVTNGKGIYTFDSVPVGGLYTITPLAIGYNFSPNERSFSLVGELTEVNFVGSPRRGRGK